MKMVVYDSGDPSARRNRSFAEESRALYGYSALVELATMARARGIELVTSDVYLDDLGAPPGALLLSDMVTPRTRTLIGRHGVQPAVMFSLESPNVVGRFYHSLERHTSPFRDVFLFGGARERVARGTRFHPVSWPNARRDVLPGPEWATRELVVMVASNKRRVNAGVGGPAAALKRVAKRVHWRYMELVDPMLRFEDLYARRLAAILHFGGREGFRLYGTGWDQSHGADTIYLEAARRSGARPVPDKLGAMTAYRFALCFENCVFPGYVTEKIFDCFFAGCVPVYLGAPDIASYVPAETFVDARRFASLAELERFMREMSAAEWGRHREAACEFLRSDAFARFRDDVFASEVLAALEDAFTAQSPGVHAAAGAVR